MILEDTIKRDIGNHFLSTEKGVVIDPLAFNQKLHGTKSIIHSNRLANVEVSAYGVFLRTVWVKRKFTRVEIATMYDISLCLKSYFIG